jgi:hypothetical protein
MSKFYHFPTLLSTFPPVFPPPKLGIDKRPEFLYNLACLKARIWKILGKNKKYLLVQIKGKEDSP